MSLKNVAFKDLFFNCFKFLSRLIPLADLDHELQLSMESFACYPDPIRPSSSLRSSLNDVHLIDHHFTFESSYERDCNITELSYVNSELDMDAFKAFIVLFELQF